MSFWPADEAEPVLDTTIGSVLRATAARYPDALAVVDGDDTARSRSYAGLLADATRIAAALLDRFRPGERVALWGPSSPDWMAFEYGAALAGLGLVTVNPGLKAGELDYVLRQSRAAGICLAAEHQGNPMSRWLEAVAPGLPALREQLPLAAWADWAPPLASGDAELPEVRPDDLAQVHFTSGTTGRPKAAMLHHRGVTNNMRFNAQRMGLGPGEVFLNPTPMFHVGGAVLANLTALAAGACLVPLRRFDPGRVLDLIGDLGVAAILGVPTMFFDLIGRQRERPREVGSLRVLLVGGSVASPELVRTLQQEFGVSVRNVYGQTECGSIIASTVAGDPVADLAESVGRPMPQIAVKITDPAGVIVPCGTPGELCVRGYQVMHGYAGMPAETTAAFDGSGWLRTGDLCTADERGYLRIVGRVKDMIISGGENIFPAEIEDVLRRHDAVADVAVVGVPDERLGEVAGAAVVLTGTPEVTGEELAAFAAGLLSREKVPRRWLFVASLPQTPSGKVRTPELREAFTDVGKAEASPFGS
jgi:fatty-acyl-CoA synthase